MGPGAIANVILAAAVLVGAGFLVYLFLLAPGRTGPELRKRAEFLFGQPYAHRGLHNKERTVPENSPAAFRAARDAGYGMELDLNLTRDGQVVVFHDADLERVCGVHGKIEEMTYEELKPLRLLDTDQGIPLFSEVLAEVDGSVPLIVELKDTPRHRRLCEAAAKLLDAYEGPYCIESFHPAIVRWFRLNRPGVIRGQLSAGPQEFTEQSPPVRLLLASLLTNVATRPHFVAYRHQDSRIGSRSRLRRRLRLYRLLGGALVGWTVTDQDDRDWCTRVFDAVIFEFYRP